MAALRTNFATITSLSELYFRYRRFILLVQTENVISMNCGSSSSKWKPWRWARLDLILMMGDIYINSNLNPLTKFTNTSKSTEFRDILSWNICQMIMKTIPVSYDKTGYSVVNLTESQWKWGQNMIGISQFRESHIRTNTSIWRNKSIQKSKTVRVTVWYPSRKVNHLSESSPGLAIPSE